MKQVKNKLHDEVQKIDQLFQSGNFKRALPIAERLFKDYPNKAISHTSLAICYSEIDRREEALQILLKAETLFPRDYDILFNIGFLKKEDGLYEEAVTYFQRTLLLIPNNKKYDRADCRNTIGACFWELHQRQDALEMWREALKEDPTFEPAIVNLRECTNDYGTAKAPNKIFDDLYQFQKIQMQKYFTLNYKTGFLDKKEAEAVLGVIGKAWNESIAPLGAKLDAMTAAEKTILFKKVECRF